MPLGEPGDLTILLAAASLSLFKAAITPSDLRTARVPECAPRQAGRESGSAENRRTSSRDSAMVRFRSCFPTHVPAPSSLPAELPARFPNRRRRGGKTLPPVDFRKAIGIIK